MSLEAGDVSQWVDRAENAGSPGFDPPVLHKLGVVVHSSNPSTWEIEAGWSGLPNYTWLHIQFQVTMIYKTSWVVGSGSCLKCQYLRGWGRKMAVSLRRAYTTKWDPDQPRKQGGSASKQSNAKQKRVIPPRLLGFGDVGLVKNAYVQSLVGRGREGMEWNRERWTLLY